MQAPLKIRFTLARKPSKTVIPFRVLKDLNWGVHGELPILSTAIHVEKARPNVAQLRQAPFVAQSLKRVPVLTIRSPVSVFERVHCWA